MMAGHPKADVHVPQLGLRLAGLLGDAVMAPLSEALSPQQGSATTDPRPRELRRQKPEQKVADPVRRPV
ncbi:hypothetical protein [Actinoplanes subtropicus]|uniref:hypothetical protein n=1 Tax=Actinoplanes subtropicus TaxID=543632 RepID=UPI000B23F3B1|nr:hypothetical protein [Actinoplanes subtropicus]